MPLGGGGKSPASARGMITSQHAQVAAHNGHWKLRAQRWLIRALCPSMDSALLYSSYVCAKLVARELAPVRLRSSRNPFIARHLTHRAAGFWGLLRSPTERCGVPTSPLATKAQKPWNHRCGATLCTWLAPFTRTCNAGSPAIGPGAGQRMIAPGNT